MWSAVQLKQHKKAADLLLQIKNDVVLYIQEYPGVTEYEVMQVILDFFKVHNLKMDAHAPIVAFGKNTSFVHYFPDKKKSLALQQETLILLDVWARLNEPKAPYADMTWMLYYGNREPDPAYVETFAHVAKARDLVLEHITDCLRDKRFPVGADCDNIARAYFAQYKLAKYFSHTLGHALGTRSPHAVYGGLRPRTKSALVPMLGYTNEPGLYFKNKYGVRSELDFYITKKRELVLTIPAQKYIETIGVV